MNICELKETLRPWMGIDTWYTNHPLDNNRFHQALHNIFASLGTLIHEDSFNQVMQQLVEEYHPDWEQNHKDNTIQKFALRAEHIANYLHDTKC